MFQIINHWQNISNFQKALYGAFVFIIIGLFYFSTNKDVEKAEIKHPIVLEEKKGFDLFDTKSWIKGEKELQILEMRSIKHQLEKELCTFENIEKVYFSFALNEQSIEKGSLIVIPKEKKVILPSVIKAMCYHISSAIKSLEPQNIAVSDASGKIYQVFGKDNLAIQTYTEEPQKIAPQIAVKEKIGFGVFKLFFVCLGFLLLLYAAFFSAKVFRKKKEQKEDLVKIMNKINVKTLSTLIAEQPPATIAMMFSYLEKERAEKLLKELPSDLQKEVQSHL